MEDFSFDIGSILSPEEADKLFEESSKTADEPSTENEKDNDAEDKVEETPSPEKVGVDDETEEDAISQQGDGSSPSVLSSIAKALVKDGIFPDFDDKELDSVSTPADFAELFEKAIDARLDERQRRIDSALGNGVEPDTVKMYEQTLQYLGSIKEDALTSEDDEGENLRRQLIYNDLINRGYSQEKANKEVEKSFKSGSDIDDAKDALEALNKYYRDGYDKVREEARRKSDEMRESQKRQSESFRKMVVDDEVKIGDVSLDKRTRQRVFEAVSKPVYKDPDTGDLLTAVQKFQKDNPLEFLKQLGMWYVLTDGGKNLDGFTKGQARAEKNKGIKELERKINASSLNQDGSLRYQSTSGGEQNMLLDDGWEIGWR